MRPGSTLGGRKPSSRGGRESPSRKVRTSQGEVVGTPTRGNPRESATETHRRWRGFTWVSQRQGGNGAVRAHRRRGDAAARQTPPDARPSRTVWRLPAKVQVGRRDGWLLKTESGLPACYGKGPLGGLFYLPVHRTFITGRFHRSIRGRLGRAVRRTPRPPP